MFGYKWQAICHAVYKDNSRALVDSCCILFEYSIMHAHKGTSGTRVLTRDVPASIIRVRSFACTRSAKCSLNCTYCVCVHHHTRFVLKFKSSCTVNNNQRYLISLFIPFLLRKGMELHARNSPQIHYPLLSIVFQWSNSLFNN